MGDYLNRYINSRLNYSCIVVTELNTVNTELTLDNLKTPLAAVPLTKNHEKAR